MGEGVVHKTAESKPKQGTSIGIEYSLRVSYVDEADE